MTIPIASDYPELLDTDENLYIVHDALRVQLIEDYEPGDTSITFDGDPIVISQFPPSGIITLTEQLSDADERAISFFYKSRTNTTFDELEKLPEFNDVSKAKRITNITLNVMAQHHNTLKDALIAIEEFIGVKGTIDVTSGGTTLVGRLNFLRKLVLTPRAWFSIDKKIGLVPLEITFKDESFRLGRGVVSYIWNFGDQDVSTISTISTIEATSLVPIDQTDILVQDLDGGTIKKIYTSPGIYDVTLTVLNENGSDTVTFRNLINARIGAPDEAVIDFIPRVNQIYTSGSPTGGPFTTLPTIKSVVNNFIDIEVPEGENSNTPNKSYGGELLDPSDDPYDPIVSYTWSLGDDLNHANSATTRAAYSIGGIYDLKLRVDTEFGAYRITTYENVINIVEKRNLWLWTYQNSTNVKSFEYGLISETFKDTSNNKLITRNDGFLTGTNNEDQAKREFKRNTGFVARSTTTSGDSGSALLFWASGGSFGSSVSDHEINGKEYIGFSDTYIDLDSIPSKPWNWAFLGSNAKAYFVFGQSPSTTPNANPSNQIKTTFNLLSTMSSNETLTLSNYLNGAEELQEHVSTYDISGVPENGYFAVYRTAWKGNNGYISRNDNIGTFFRIKSFYRTEGNIAEPFQNIRKLADISGLTKSEGQLVALTNGIFFFNNSGNVSAFNDVSESWETGNISFTSLQDSTVTDFDNENNSLLAASDGDRIAILSFDYSSNSFIKFNGTDTTFSSLGSRPTGEQWMMGVY